MQITLKQSEIEVAVRNYIAQQGISLRNKTTAVTFTAGRGESRISAEIDIEDTGVAEGNCDVGVRVVDPDYRAMIGGAGMGVGIAYAAKEEATRIVPAADPFAVAAQEKQLEPSILKALEEEAKDKAPEEAPAQKEVVSLFGT